MDPVTIFQTVGTAVELAGVTYKIISAGSDMYKQGRKNLPLNESRERATKDLSALNADFIERYSRVPTEKLSAEERRRIEMCKACNEIAVELIEALGKLEIQGEEKSKRKALGVALKSVWNESDIEEKKQRLEEYRSQLMAGYVMSILKSTEKQAAASEKHQRGLEDVGKVLQAIETSSSSRHDSSVAQNELLLDSINQIKARLDVGTLKPPSSMADGKYPSRSQSVTSLGGFTMVENDSIAPIQTIHAIVESGDREALYDKLDEDPLAVRTKDDAGRTPLHIACLKSNERIVQDLIGKGARVDALDKQFCTPLHCAAELGLVRIVRKLLAAGANSDLENRDDLTPWHLAVDYPEVQWILRNGASLEARNSNDETALVHFTREGKLEIVASLLDQGANVNAHGMGEQTALIEAAWQNNYEMVELLLSHDNGPDINGVNLREDTALGAHCQLDEADIRIFRKLMDAGPDISMRNDCNFNPAFEAAAHGHPEQLKALIDMGAELNMCEVGGYSPLTWAARAGHADTVEILLAERKFKPDDEDTRGQNRTALMKASKHGHLALVKVLLRYGANVNLRDTGKTGYTALHQAVVNKRKDIIVELLKVKDINLDAPSAAQWRPICEAAARHETAIVQLLLEAGANPNVADDQRLTPLMKAAKEDFTDVVELLLDRKARIDTVDEKGQTALYMCVYANQLETTRLLLKRGANIRVATRDKAYTPLCMASLIGNLAMVKLLLEYGASAASESNIDSWTPLHEAALYGHYKVAQVLLEHGADPLARNTERQGRKSPLTLAAEFEQIKLVKLMCNYIDD